MKKLIMLAFIAITSVSVSLAQTKTSLNEVLSSYYKLKNALADDKADAAVTQAKELLTKIESAKVTDLPADQQKLWIQKSTAIKAKTKALAATSKIEAQRKVFEGITMPMIDLVKAITFNTSTAYVQYCPHAKKSWLNDVEAVQNPYYGSMMYACGSVREELDGK